MALFVGSAPDLQAQTPTSREVVQPLPTTEVQRLNRALRQLARQPRSVQSLLEAGDASLALDDLDAAIGFYGRAADISSSDFRVKLGLAKVYLRSGRPIEAIPLFSEAEAMGAAPSDFLSDQALALDLIGNQAAAQGLYARALELTPDDDRTRRRLALSHAISGNANQFQAVLSPLLEKRDTGAFRARAFGLAILGEQDRAEAIVNAVMPPDLSARINPYLAYMPRLTPAQQAAAANLGIFPRAADIGREDPRITRFARGSKVDARLEPAGEPLGTLPAPLGTQISEVEPDPNLAPAETTEVAGALPEIKTTEVLDDPKPVRPSASVADAFADMESADLPVSDRRTDAVNIAEIEVPREIATEVKAAVLEHPRRIWVQLATGRDVAALGFDWRRLKRKADGLLDQFDPHVTPWGQANRLLAGPVKSAQNARELVNALAEKGIETFSYTSPEGVEIQPLD